MARLWLLLLLHLLHQTYAALEIFAPSPQRTLNGSNVVLNCTLSVDKPPIDPNLLAILWYFQGDIVLRYDNKGMTNEPRTSLSVEAARNGNASLSLANVTFTDGGTYTCVVIYSPERMEKKISLVVQASPVISIINKDVSINKENTLYCKVTGFFPPDIAINWLVDDVVVENQFVGKPQQDKDGTYWVNSIMKITPREENQKKSFSCRVQHASLQGPLQEDFQLVYKDDTSTISVIVGCIIVLLLISAAVIGIFWWKQHLRKGTFTVKNIEGPSKLFHGEETTLYCTATTCPEDICVTWLERRAGEVHEIQQSQPVDIEEEEKLLDTSYIIKSRKERHLYSSSMRFIPYMEYHKDVTFICKYVSGKRSAKKKFHCKTIYGKPQLLQPVSRSLFVFGNMTYLMFLERFYPKSINITWTCGVEKSQDIIPSTETFTENPDGTFNVSSEVRMSEDLLKDPGFRVQVTWEHESLDKPGHKELSIRDPEYAWNPIVEEIEKPTLLYNTPVTLQCNISEYFPDAVTVKWLRRKDQEIREESDGLFIPNIPSNKNTDNTYSCTSKLIITPTPRSHQGSEYICRVEHPSLERPIERSTRELNVIAKPHMTEPIKVTAADSSRVRFSLNLQTFWPKDIKIYWHYEFNFEKYVMDPTQTFIDHDDCTLDVTSECNLPIAAFKDPNVKVEVTWKHESMNRPETRSLSIRDLCWRPEIGDIKFPELEANKPVTLTCKISGYFPYYLTVTWFKMKDGNMTELPITKDNTYKVSDNRECQEDQTFFLDACLTFTPSISSDQGSEFICRVKHPSLQDPIDRSTGPLEIVGSTVITDANSVPPLSSTTSANTGIKCGFVPSSEHNVKERNLSHSCCELADKDKNSSAAQKQNPSPEEEGVLGLYGNEAPGATKVDSSSSQQYPQSLEHTLDE
ncbi:uncharacterized protein LOC142097315 [Mixophyes fleayi]|uniref:uncharacterized protein LOC142097315 n=1 Tax=Mixophyes fleayi TaxID=3061075 RepID=UPI003F4D7DF8